MSAEVLKAFEDFKKANDERLAQIEAKGHADPLLAEKVDKINAALTEAENKVKARIDDLETKLNRANFGGGGGASEQDQARAEYRKEFGAFFRRGVDNGLDDLAIKAALSVGSDPDGGFTVPFELDQSISRVMAKYSAMRSLATVRTIGAASFKTLINLAGNQSGWVGDTDSGTETNTPKLAELEYPAMTVYSFPFATQEMLDDSFLDIEGWLADEVAIDFSEQEGAAFITGNGVKKPRGLLSYPVVANASYAHGKLGYIASGAAGAFVSGVTQADCLVDLVHSIKRGYRQNASFLMNTLTLGTIRKFKDTTGEYLYTPTLGPAMPAQFMGYSIEEDDNMPDIAANSYSVAFGDFKQGYLIVDRMGVRVLRDPLTKKGYVGFYTTKRVGGGVKKFEAIKLLKMAAS
jgi:HK97 family phage major capsid protein